MSQPDDPELEAAAALAPEQLSDELSAEIAAKWDPERILKLVATRAGKGEALDATLRARYERRLGVDLGHVRVYTGELATELNRNMGANAVTIGTTGMILMGGATDRSMATAAGQALLAHELTHVAQAQRGVHKDAVDGAAMPLATDEHEAEAEAHEAQVMAEEQGGTEEHDAAAAHDQLSELVQARVLDMLAEHGRVFQMRSGPRTRRS